jgi:hypothetical protein
MPQNASNWSQIDPYPEVPLEAIQDPDLRIMALLARRSSAPIMQTHNLNIKGAAESLSGITYHAKQHERLLWSETNQEEALRAEMRHEITAYFNRCGQFYYFLKSDPVKEILSGIEKSCTELNRVMLFRHKITAHRSIDKPWREDTIELQVAQALALLGRTWEPKSEKAAKQELTEEPRKSLRGSHYLIYKVHDAENCIQFSIERDHQKLFSECEAALSRIVGA